RSDRPQMTEGVALAPLDRQLSEKAIEYPNLRVDLDRERRQATLTLRGPENVPDDDSGIRAAGADFWPLALAREIDDGIVQLRFNEPRLGTLVFRSEGDPEKVLSTDVLLDNRDADWLVREIRLFWQRVLKRIDLTSRSLFTLIEPGSCFAGFLAELVFAA